VTMLGGGVASDRTAQIQTISALLDRRPRCLHLVVVWPNSRVSPGHYGWPGTRVVRTHNSLALAAAADLVVSAAGYNSFHELLYHGIPTIFIPQVAPYLDDQERRARAASERGLAETVLSHELLRLERAITAFLDGGEGEAMRNRLRDHVLPEPGNRVAARLIEDGGQT
jgi:UDP:flavonoid glycosyltransferase YjiC (YdhE family)